MLGDPTSSHLSSNKGHHFCKKKTNQNHLLGSCLVGGWTNPFWKNMLVNMQVFPQFSGRKKKQTTKQICIFVPQQKKYIHLIPLHEHQVWLNMYTITQLIFL